MKFRTSSLFSSSLRVVFSSTCGATAVAVFSLTGLQSADAQLIWNSAGPSNLWSTAAPNTNWNPGAVVWSQNESAVFNGASGTPEAIDVATANVFKNITFDVTGFSITSAGAGSFLLANDLSSTISVTNAADSASIAETIANNSNGASTLTKAGPGTLNLNGTAANTYSGGTVVNAGTLVASHEGSLGAGVVTNNAKLQINKANVTFTGLSTAMTGVGIAEVTALGTGSNTVTLGGDYSAFTGKWDIGIGAATGAGKVQMNGLDSAAAEINVRPNATVFTNAGVHNAKVILNGGDTGESFGQLRVELLGTVWAGPITLAGEMTGAGDGIIGTNSGPVTVSGIISESGGARSLTKSGSGTMSLTGANTYTGPTRVLTGNLSIPTINNTGTNGPLGTNANISLGYLTTGASLIYTGAGESTNRNFELAGTVGGGGINHSGTGLLELTGNITASGAGAKNVTITVPPTASAEFAGQLSNSVTTGSTTLSTAFVAAATSVTLSSVEGIVVGAPISGTGLTGGTTVTAINTGTRVVTISPAASGAGAVNQIMTVAGVTNPSGIQKEGLGSLKVSGSSPFTGGVNIAVGNLIVTNSGALGLGTKTVALTNGTAGNPQLHLDGSAGDITLPANISYNTSNTSSATSASIVNLAGNNTVAGNITLTSGGGGTRLLSDAGKLTISGNISSNTSGRNLEFRGAADGEVSGIIANGSASYPVIKDGTGTWKLSGDNTYTGATSIVAGTLVISGNPSGTGITSLTGGLLKLDYSTNDTSKLNSLSLGGGTLELSGGTHIEDVASTTLIPGTVTTVTRSSGTAILQMRTVNASSGVVQFTANGIATTDSNNTNDILPWARFGSLWGTNSTNNFDGPIIAYAAGFTDFTRLGGVIPDDVTKQVRIVNGGPSGNVKPATDYNYIGSLQMDASAGPATIGHVEADDTIIIPSIWQTATAGALTIGSSLNHGILTTEGQTLTLINDSPGNPLTINSVIDNIGSVVKGGAGQVILTANNTLFGTITTGGGTLTLSGNNPSLGSLTVAAGSTAILTGDNNGRNAGLLNLNTVLTGGTLQIQANSGNTVGGISTVLSGEQTANQPLVLNNGGFLQLRSDSPVTFAGANNFGGLGSSTVNIDVNQVTAAGTGNTLTLAPLGSNVNTTGINVTGGNGYTLALGKINNVAAGGVMTLNPTTANLSLDGYSANATFSTTLVLGGTAPASTVTGNITNPATSGATTVTKNGSGTWSVNGAANTYTGAININDGKLIAGNSTSLGVGSTLNMAGSGILDLNANSITLTNWGAGVNTSTITDNGAAAGTSILRGNTVTNTLASLITDGPTRKVGVVVANANTNTAILGNTNNTFSGDFTLAYTSGNGTRLTPAALVNGGVTGSPGAITSGPYGRGSIILGQAATDKSGIIVSAANTLLVNPLVVNTALGTDFPGIRVDSTGNVISGSILANLSNLHFSTSGNGFITLTGRISSGATSTGISNSDTTGASLTITLANTGAPNNYTGATSIGTKAILRLGADNQIPNGSTASDATINGQLQLAGFNETLNGLNGAGTITSSVVGSVLTIGDNNTTATFSGSSSGSLALNKIGSGIQIFSGSIAHTGDTTVAGGTLWVSGASTFSDNSAIRLATGTTLNLNTAGTDVVNALYIDGVQQAGGTWGKIGSGAAHESALITGNGQLSVTTSGGSGSPFTNWINTFFPGETNPAIIGQNADPDGDGASNITEFAYDGTPNNGAKGPKVFVFAADSDFDGNTDKELILTAAIRTGAPAFSSAAPSTSVSATDGITYSIQGTTTLTTFPVTVNVVPTPVITDLPSVSSGYSYRSFSLQGSDALTGKGFLRAGVITP